MPVSDAFEIFRYLKQCLRRCFVFFLSWKRTNLERGWPARPTALIWGALEKQSFENQPLRPDPSTHVASLFSYSFIFQPIFFLPSPPEESVIRDSCVLAGVHVLSSLAVFYFAHIKTVSAKLSNSLWACKQQNIIAAGCYRSQLSIYLCCQVHSLAIRPIIVTLGGTFSCFPAVLQWCLKITRPNCR